MKGNTGLLTRMALLTALGVVASYASAIPAFGAKLFPAQHALNVVAGALLGPVYGAVTALAISLIRIALGTGTPLAIPGSLFGVVLAGLLYRYLRSRYAAMAGEMIGTGVIGALVAWPVATFLLGNAKAAAGGIAFFVVPFALSSISGAIVGAVALAILERIGQVPSLQAAQDR